MVDANADGHKGQLFYKRANPQKRKRSDYFDINKDVANWVHSNARCEFGDKEKDGVRFFVNQNMKQMATEFASFHKMVRTAGEHCFVAIFCPEGGKDPDIPSYERFRQAWPEDVEQESLHECTCTQCHAVDLALEDLLIVIKAVHKNDGVFSHASGVKGQCSDDSCPWKTLPKLTATGGCALFCLDKNNQHGIPFLLCGECKCQNSAAEPIEGGGCGSRNGLVCNDCGAKKFPLCPWLVKTNPMCSARESVPFKKSGGRLSTVTKLKKRFNSIFAHFCGLFAFYIEHGLGKLHANFAKKALLEKVAKDSSRMALFLDWSMMLQLKQLWSAVGDTPEKLGVAVGIAIGSVNNVLTGQTVIGISDDHDNSNYATFVFLARVLQMLKSKYPSLKLLTLFSDGGPKHFRTTLTFALLPHLQRMFGIDLEWMFFKVRMRD